MNAARFIRRSVIAFWVMVNFSIAGPWLETFDAGMLPTQPQILSGSGAISSIQGTIAGLDVDLFRIYISDPAHTFSAFASGWAVNLDPQLFLFSDSGFGIASTEGGASGLASLAQLSGAAPAYYWLGVSPSNIDPYTTKVQSLPGWSISDYPIFFQCGSGPCGPTPQGEQFALGGWGGNYHGIEGSYVIRLTGAYFSAPEVAIPEPSSAWLLVVCLLLALAACRLRRTSSSSPLLLS